MARFFETVVDLAAQADVLARRRYGLIEVVDGRLVAVYLRPWPKIALADEVLLAGWLRGLRRGDRCLVYYNQPRRLANFLAVTYAVSNRDCSYATLRRAAQVVDQIAQLKRTDAIVCDVRNRRISDRLLARWGWAPHCPSRWHRNFIKRLYPGDRASEDARVATP
jgi:hypothetical protein